MPKGRDNDTGPIEKEGNLMKNSDFEEEEENEDNVASLAFDIWRSSPGKEEQNQISSNPSEVAAPNTEFQSFREELEVGPPSEPRLIEFFPSSESNSRDNNKGDDIPSAPDIRDEFVRAPFLFEEQLWSMQMENQRRLQNQPELRIDAQWGYENSILKRASQTVGVANNIASGRESRKGSGTNSGKSPIILSDDDFIGSIYEGNETAAGHNPGNTSFRKRLTTSDASCSYLYLPVEVSKQHFPTLKLPENETILNVLDHQNKTWEMKFKRNSQRCLIGGDWGKFVRKYQLQAEDEISFSKVEHHQPSDGNHYLIRFKKNCNAAASGSEAKKDKGIIEYEII